MLLDQLLPPAVVAAEAFGDPPDPAPFPGEEDLIAKAVPARRHEFITARRCAREALARLGHPPAPIRTGPAREPLWPPGVVGSITHCPGYRAAAVARATDLACLGIDAEPNGPLPPGVLDSVSLPPERAMLTGLASTDPEIHWDRLLFSAKESIYKAWYPIAQRWLGFEDAVVTLDRAARTFTAEILIPGPLTHVAGHWLAGRGLLLTAVALPRP